MVKKRKPSSPEKWTARQPVAGEKHFIVVGHSAAGGRGAGRVELEAVYSGRRRWVAEEELVEAKGWHQGWH